MINKNNLKNDVLLVSKGYVSLSELELECLVDIIAMDERIDLAFFGTSRETDGVFVFTDKRIVFIARTRSMKDFFCLYEEYDRLCCLDRQTNPDDPSLNILFMLTEDGEIFDIDRLTSDRAELLYRKLLKLLGEEPIEHKDKNKRSMPTIVKFISLLGIVFVVFSVINIVFDGDETGTMETSSDDVEFVSHQREINFVEDGVVEVEGEMKFEYKDYFFTDAIKPPNSEDDFATYLIDNELFTYLIVEAEVTNISKNPLNIQTNSPLFVELVVDDVHNYYPMVDHLTNNDSEFSYSDVEPSETVTAYYMFRIPKKFVDSEDSFVLHFDRSHEKFILEYITSLQVR
ncbi:hypothetical protein ACWE42_07380 [Sutcliffiella cohnii]|uniref:hypothetical protein n=1 Tax=Sutcliffiella sp. NC1 TaxID=3004096 RepID=UPI0022DD4407|nr:hypothetical protein [Sutcliffiella sp. NC1]WBL14195.1 hypothetical protein O1A01_20135 [Sutcliffiella sp. NC1]